MRALLVSIMAVAGLLGGCRGQTSEESPVAILRNMYQQPKYVAQADSEFFEDGRAMRPPVEGTVAREMEMSEELAEGRTADGFVDTIPSVMVQRAGGMQAMLTRGQERYGIYCTPCHDGLGTGKGMVIERAKNPGFAPPTLHDDRLRHMPDGQLFQTISKGYNNMPAYGAQVPLEDRWSIVAYVRALQLSQPESKEASL